MEKILQVTGLAEEQGSFLLELLLRDGTGQVSFCLELDKTTYEGLQSARGRMEQGAVRLSFCSADLDDHLCLGILMAPGRQETGTTAFVCSRDFIRHLCWLKSRVSAWQLAEQLEGIRETERKDQEPEKARVHTGIFGKRWKKALKPLAAGVFLFLAADGFFFIPSLGSEAIKPGVSFPPLESSVASFSLEKRHGEESPDSNNYPKKEEPPPAYELSGEGVIREIPEDYVALTFDDGPTVYTKKIIRLLAEHDVGGTFFFIGNNVSLFPEAVRKAGTKGYTTGNHSYTHPYLTQLAPQLQERELQKTSQVLAEKTGEEIRLFRPPYGDLDSDLHAEAVAQGMKTVMWSIDTRDWETSCPDSIAASVRRVDPAGKIILFHESRATLEALPLILEYLQERDLKIVSLR